MISVKISFDINDFADDFVCVKNRDRFAIEEFELVLTPELSEVAFTSHHIEQDLTILTTSVEQTVEG